MPHISTEHEVLAAVFQVRGVSSPTHPGNPHFTCCCGSVHWSRRPESGHCRAAGSRDDEDLTSSVRRQLAEKVDLRELAHLEQLAVFSDPDRVPGHAHHRVDVPRPGALPRDPELPPDTRWHPVSDLPPMAFDHGPMVEHARTRLVAKLSYTNIGFALAPTEFALSTLRDIYSAALGHPVDATNLQRVLERRNVITRTGTTARSGRSGGRPAALYRFTDARYRVTDEFAALRPPG